MTPMNTNISRLIRQYECHCLRTVLISNQYLFQIQLVTSRTKSNIKDICERTVIFLKGISLKIRVLKMIEMCIMDTIKSVMFPPGNMVFKMRIYSETLRTT